MKKNKFLALLAGSAVSFGLANGTTLISNNFDGDSTNDIGATFQSIDNGRGGDVNLAAGVFASGNATDSSRGINNTELTTLTSGATSFTVTYVINGVTDRTPNNDNDGGVDFIQNNGFFLGVVTGTNATGTNQNALFNNNPLAVGVRLVNNNTPNQSPFQFIQEFEGNGNGDFQRSLFVIPTNASVADGLTLTFTIHNDDTWTASSIGLSSEINSRGNLRSGIYEEFATNGIGLNASVQGVDARVQLDSVSLVANGVTTATTATTAVPEPATTTLVGLSGLVLLLRRKRA